MNRNKRLYRCGECARRFYATAREENRAGRLKCPACGSARLEVSALGADRLAVANDAKRNIIDGRKARSAGAVRFDGDSSPEGRAALEARVRDELQTLCDAAGVDSEDGTPLAGLRLLEAVRRLYPEEFGGPRVGCGLSAVLSAVCGARAWVTTVSVVLPVGTAPGGRRGRVVVKVELPHAWVAAVRRLDHPGVTTNDTGERRSHAKKAEGGEAA